MIQKFNFGHARPISSPRFCLEVSLNMGDGSKWSINFMFVSYLKEPGGTHSQTFLFGGFPSPCFVEADRRNLQEAIPRSLADGPGVQRLEIRFVPTCQTSPTTSQNKWLVSGNSTLHNLASDWLLCLWFINFHQKKTVCSKVKLKLLGFHNPHCVQVAQCSLTCTLLTKLHHAERIPDVNSNYFGFLCCPQSEEVNVPSLLCSLCPQLCTLHCHF